MILQTGGTAVGEISTRSSPRSRASFIASKGGRTPTCVPSSSIKRTSRTRIRSFTRRLRFETLVVLPPQDNLTRLGSHRDCSRGRLRNSPAAGAVPSPKSIAQSRGEQGLGLHRAGFDPPGELPLELGQRLRPQVAPAAGAGAGRARGGLLLGADPPGRELLGL